MIFKSDEYSKGQLSSNQIVNHNHPFWESYSYHLHKEVILPQPNDHSGKVGVEVHSRLTPASTFNENEKFSLKSFSCILSTRPISTPASTSSTQKPLVPQVPQLPEFTKYLKCLKKPQVPQVPKYLKYPSTSSTSSTQVLQVPKYLKYPSTSSTHPRTQYKNTCCPPPELQPHSGKLPASRQPPGTRVPPLSSAGSSQSRSTAPFH